MCGQCYYSCVRPGYNEQGDEEETEGRKNVVLPEDAEIPVDRKKNKPRSFADGKSENGVDYANKKDAALLRGNGPERLKEEERVDGRGPSSWMEIRKPLDLRR